MPSFPHVIIAEDEPLVAVTVAGMLEEGGYRVTLARDGLEALEVDAHDPADVLVTDLRMPRLDGIGLIDRMRERHPGLPVVVMTGYSDVFPDASAGHLVIIHKPFWGDQIVRAVGAVLGS